MLIKMKVSTRIKKIDFILNFIFAILFLIGSFSFFLNNYLLSYYITLYAFVIFYFKNVIHIIKSNISTIDIYINFFIFYFLCGFILFNSKEFIHEISLFFQEKQKGVFSLLTHDNLVKINYIYIVSLFPFMFLFNNTSQRLEFTCKPIYLDESKLSLFSKFCGTFTIFLILCFSFPLIIYIYVTTGGQYALTVDTLEGKYTNLLGWNTVIISSLIPFCYVRDNYKNKKIFTFIIVLLSLAILKIHFRMHSAIILMCLLINFEIRGFKIKFKHFLFLLLVFFIITFQALLRYQNFNYNNSAASISALLGEFFLSQFYLVSTAINPYDYEVSFVNYFDFAIQMLPTSIRPESAIRDFLEYNHQYGLEAAPIGGLSIIGQSILYLGYFFPIGLWLIGFFLFIFKKIILNKIPHLALAGLPISLMILPRVDIWGMRSFLIGITLLLFLKLIFNTFLKAKLLKTKSNILE